MQACVSKLTSALMVVAVNVGVTNAPIQAPTASETTRPASNPMSSFMNFLVAGMALSTTPPVDAAATATTVAVTTTVVTTRPLNADPSEPPLMHCPPCSNTDTNTASGFDDPPIAPHLQGPGGGYAAACFIRAKCC